MNFNPKVSIIIPVYNGSNYLRQAIDSAVTQTYKNIEIMVVNDGSDDGGTTRDIALSYGDRIRYFEKKNGGVATALNLGISEMTGEYFSWLSHDDVYYENKVEAQITYLKGLKSKMVVLFSDFELIDENSHLLHRMELSNNIDDFCFWLTMNNSLHGCTLLIPKKCFDVCGKFDSSLITTQDYDMWFRIAEKFNFARVPCVLIKSRRHKEQGIKILHRKAVEECNLLMIRFFSKLNNAKIGFRRCKLMVLSFYNRQFYVATYYACSCLLKANGKTTKDALFLYKYKILSLTGLIARCRFLLKYIKE